MKNTICLQVLFLVFPLLFSSMGISAAPKKKSVMQEQMIPLKADESFYVLTHLVDETQPTLIFLPGIYRGFLQDEKFLSLLTAKKINWVAYHTSRHPESILRGTPNPWLRQITSADLAAEVLKIKQSLLIQKPIVVSLSYSSSISPHLKKKDFPIIIETAPMILDQETNPPSPYYESWKQWMNLFPVVGPSVVNTQEYWAYRGHWLKEAQELSESYSHYNRNLAGVAEGLAQLAFATRSFDLRDQDFAKGPQRFWIIGEHEEEARKELQIEAIQLYEGRTGRQNSAFLIKNAGHIIPNENPAGFVATLSRIIKQLSAE